MLCPKALISVWMLSMSFRSNGVSPSPSMAVVIRKVNRFHATCKEYLLALFDLYLARVRWHTHSFVTLPLIFDIVHLICLVTWLGMCATTGYGAMLRPCHSNCRIDLLRLCHAHILLNHHRIGCVCSPLFQPMRQMPKSWHSRYRDRAHAGCLGRAYGCHFPRQLYRRPAVAFPSKSRISSGPRAAFNS